jgi:glycosyltransferase involved in cell wall biosynthesis
LRTLQPGYPTVSVIVPNYNYARHLRERLLSIFEQTHPVFEIIVLDDASADDSVAVARAVAESAGRSLRIVERAVNSGNVFRQWYAGLEMARGDFVWIAEADDSADPNFLAEAVKALKGDPAPSFCFTDSCAIDAEGATIYNDYKGYYREFGDDGLDRDGDFDSADFLRRFLAVRNHVLNASSVVWRSALLRRVFDNLGEEAFAYRCAGDWRIYVEACRLSPRVHYIAEPLNRHRRHDKSVTGMIDARAHYHEVERVQSAALSALDDDADLRGEVETWMGSLRDHWRLDSEDEAETTG